MHIFARFLKVTCFFLTWDFKFDLAHFFRHKDIDGETKGGNSGGKLTTLFNNINDWLHTSNNWNKLKVDIAKEVAQDGLLKAYRHDCELLTPQTEKKISDMISWMKEEGAIQFKRGDYGNFEIISLFVKIFSLRCRKISRRKLFIKQFSFLLGFT